MTLQDHPNRIALAALRTLYGAPLPGTLEVAEQSVTLSRVDRGPATFPSGIAGLDVAADGPWPGGFDVACNWGTGEVTLHVRAGYWQWYQGPPAARVAHRRVAIWVLLSSGQQLMQVEVVQGDSKTGNSDTSHAQARVFSGRTPHESKERGRQLLEATWQQVHVSGLPITGRQVTLFDLILSTREIRPSPEEALKRLIHLALLRLPSMTRDDPNVTTGAPLWPLPAASEQLLETMGLNPDVADPEGKDMDQSDGAERVDDTTSYSAANLYADIFSPPEEIDRWLRLWHRKKNLVLQGPPGVGKTFVARRLAWALMGEQDDARIVQVQFHQSYGYEDFVRGYRPTKEGGFELRDGVFLDLCRRATEDKRRHVLIIDEINRGNLSRIFGELLTLLEQDKRGVEQALVLANPRLDEGPLHVPDNVYVLGMMNTADRSLAVVDYALRRRFAFVDVAPAWSRETLRRHLQEVRGLPSDFVGRLTTAMQKLNDAIAKDRDLGPGYRVGHSHVSGKEPVKDWQEWWRDVVHGEIGPLLREMWFDRHNEARLHVEALDRLSEEA